MATHFRESPWTTEGFKEERMDGNIICKRVSNATNANLTYFALLLMSGTGFSTDITQMSHSIL